MTQYEKRGSINTREVLRLQRAPIMHNFHKKKVTRFQTRFRRGERLLRQWDAAQGVYRTKS